MKLSDFIRSLTTAELDAYAARCNTSSAYISTHLLHARKEPRKKLRLALATESGGKVSLAEVLAHFGIGSIPEPENENEAAA